MKETMDKQIAYLEYINRENSFHHHHFSDELSCMELIRNGDMRSVEQDKKMFTSNTSGHLSDDPIKNRIYLNICHVTLCTRFAIEGGMDSEKAFNASDLFIQRFEKAKTEQELIDIRFEITEYFTKQVAAAKKANIFSKPVIECMDYIDLHLHEAIAVRELAKMVGLNESYLSVLFKREAGMNLTQYVTKKRMEAAENMLRISDFSLAEISDILHFSSYSHFARTFRKYYAMSPRQYRAYNFCRMKIGTGQQEN